MKKIFLLTTLLFLISYHTGWCFEDVIETPLPIFIPDRGVIYNDVTVPGGPIIFFPRGGTVIPQSCPIRIELEHPDGPVVIVEQSNEIKIIMDDPDDFPMPPNVGPGIVAPLIKRPHPHVL